jgi:hypothetical protein
MAPRSPVILTDLVWLGQNGILGQNYRPEKMTVPDHLADRAFYVASALSPQ